MAEKGAGKEQPQLGFPNIGEEDDPNARQQADGQPPEGEGGDKPTLEDVQRELDALKASRDQDKQAMDSLRADKDRLLQGLLQTRDAGAPSGQGGQPSPQPEPELNLDDMPDPVEKAAEFKTWFAGALKKASQRPPQQPAAQGQPPNLAAVDQVWNEFLSREDNADLKEHSRLAIAIAQEEAGKLRARGIDPQRAVMMDPDGVLGRVAASTRKEIERIRGKQDDGDGDGDGDGDRGTNKQGANRTAGVSGGSKPNGRGGKPQPQVTSFADDLKREQVKSGFF